MPVRPKVARAMRRAAQVLVQQSNKLDPPVTKSAAQQAIDLFNASVRRVAREAWRVPPDEPSATAALGFVGRKSEFYRR